MAKADIERARATFNSLDLKEWSEDTLRLKGGGQAALLVLLRGDGSRGVFRFLRSKDHHDLARFFREVELLSRPEFQHPCIVKLLDWTKDRIAPWYISELGQPFGKWWQYLRRRQRRAVGVLKKAIAVLLDLTDGLSRLHDAGCVHRDIKPANIIVRDDGTDIRPVLIDFGVAYIEGGERLTRQDEAVGNVRFSPDVAMNRMDWVTPWLDVFQLSQLLMWMVAKRPAKDTWLRPVDWRWVNYPDELPYQAVVALRAITALCSEQALAPKNAGQLRSLLRERLSFLFKSKEESRTMHFDTDAIHSALSAGKSEHDIAVVNDLRHIDSAAPDAERFYAELAPKVDVLVATAKHQSVPCQRMPCHTLPEYIALLRGNPTEGHEGRVLEIECGRGAASTFTVSMQCYAYIPSSTRFPSWPALPASSNLFTFSIERFVHDRNVPRTKKRITLESDGTLMLRDESMAPLQTVTIDDVVREFKTAMEDLEAWRAISRRR